MTEKITISIPDKLKRAIEEYNSKHPFEKLIISQLAQKAIFEKIKAVDPELLTNYTKAPAAVKAKEITLDEAKEITLDEELTQPPQEEIQHHTLEVVCVECGKQFTAKRATRKFCSGKCKTAYGRKPKE